MLIALSSLIGLVSITLRASRSATQSIARLMDRKRPHGGERGFKKGAVVRSID
mgnify:CR=1 FL=1